MKSSALGTILGLVSLVGVGALYFKIDRIEERIRPTEHGRAEIAPVVLDNEVGTVPGPRLSAAEFDEIPETDRRPGSPTESDLGRGTVEERIARLESMEKNRTASGRSNPGPVRPAPFPLARKLARSVEDLSNALKLTQTQTDRVHESVGRAKRLIEDVLKIPDESGVSPYEQLREKRKKMEAAVKSGNTNGIISFALDSRAYRARPIPGRNTTYGAEIDRIKRESREEISGVLDNEQQEEFGGLQTDALYGEGGALTTSVFIAGDTVIEENR